jgi:hypothetical protein
MRPGSNSLDKWVPAIVAFSLHFSFYIDRDIFRDRLKIDWPPVRKIAALRGRCNRFQSAQYSISNEGGAMNRTWWLALTVLFPRVLHTRSQIAPTSLTRPENLRSSFE